MLVSERDGRADLSQLYVGKVRDAGEQSLRDCVGANKLDSSQIHVTTS